MKVIGHRGAKGLAPENTLASFAKALEHHVDEIELDVRVSLDGQVIVHHNRNVRDASGNSLLIAKTNFSELQAHKSDLVTLEQALRFIDRQVPVIVEIKRHEPVKPVAEVLALLLENEWDAKRDLRLGSKSQPILRECQDLLPDVPRIVIESWSGVRASYRARQVGAKRLHMQQLWLWGYFIGAMERGGYELAAYTLNDPKKAQRWARRGLAAVITDTPDKFEK